MEIVRPHKSNRRLAKRTDPVASALAANLVYVSDQDEGIRREMSDEDFTYRLGNRRLRNKDHLHRISALVIPPAWQRVWICPIPTGHLQATGYDALNRKQYRYHHAWNNIRQQTKYHRLLQFGEALPAIRKAVQADLKVPALTQNKVLATAIQLMELTHIRVGNSQYEKLYGSFGLTTLKDKHAIIDGTAIRFSFKGKKGVTHDISFKNKRLAQIIKACRDIPGKELFQYYDENKERRSIDSGMVNNYIKCASNGADYTAKDFRTWWGTMHAVDSLLQMGCPESEKECKEKVVAMLDYVSQHLGNTRTVCRKYYVHPGIIDLFEQRALPEVVPNTKLKPLDGLSQNENLLLQILGEACLPIKKLKL